jgi:hypothetical protein
MIFKDMAKPLFSDGNTSTTILGPTVVGVDAQPDRKWNK